MCYGMSTTSYRTTFALDEATARRLRSLASTWQVSQAEVVRRAIAMADKTVSGKNDTASLLRSFHQAGKTMVREEAERYLEQTRHSRKDWRGDRLICLDTNYLILSLVPDSREANRLIEWSEAGERFLAPAVVWYEFLCGPVNKDQIAVMHAMLHEIVSFDASHSEEAARLWNSTGRRRDLRVDTMIAAAALLRDAPLATNNHDDFAPFVNHGLHLLA